MGVRVITWITGNSGAGKTTLAHQSRSNEIILDGDALRKVWTDLDLTREGRWEHNLRTARLAKMLADQGFGVIVATICPYAELRRHVQSITGCVFVYLHGGHPATDEYPYEYQDGDGI